MCQHTRSLFTAHQCAEALRFRNAVLMYTNLSFLVDQKIERVRVWMGERGGKKEKEDKQQNFELVHLKINFHVFPSEWNRQSMKIHSWCGSQRKKVLELPALSSAAAINLLSNAVGRIRGVGNSMHWVSRGEGGMKRVWEGIPNAGEWRTLCLCRGT